MSKTGSKTSKTCLHSFRLLVKRYVHPPSRCPHKNVNMYKSLSSLDERGHFEYFFYVIDYIGGLAPRNNEDWDE